MSVVTSRGGWDVEGFRPVDGRDHVGAEPDPLVIASMVGGAEGVNRPERVADAGPGRRDQSPPSVRSLSSAPGSASARDAHVLEEAAGAADRAASLWRLGISSVLALVLARYGPDMGRHDGMVATAVGANLAFSLIGVAVASGRRHHTAMAWASGLFDVTFLSFVIACGRWSDVLPSRFDTALASGWAMFTILALTNLRGRPWLLLSQAALFTGVLAVLVTAPDGGRLEDAASSGSLALLFGSAQNLTRLCFLALCGIVLAASAVHGRSTLVMAVAAARRAEALSRFFAPSVATLVTEAELADIRDGREQHVAILFADVRGFTTLSETLPPREIAAFLTEFRRRTSVVSQFGTLAS